MSHSFTSYEAELEDEFEDEQEVEGEDEWEDEGEAFNWGGVANAIGGLLGEGEEETEWEDEDEAEAFNWGGVANAIGGLLGEGEEETEWEDEDEGEAFNWGGIANAIGGLLGEGEEEDEDEAEEFFKNIGRAFRKAAPFLKVLAKNVGPLVATAVGGPAAGMLARAVTSQLEGEGEEELEAELEDMATAPLPGGQALAEYFAAHAAQTESESEAEAFAGVAAYAALSRRDRRDLERMLPALLRGSAVITRLLHGNRRTRPAVRLVPGIVDATGRTLARRVAAGQPVGPVEVGQVLGNVTRRVLYGGRGQQAVVRRHARGVAHARRHYRGTRSGRGYYGAGSYGGRRGYGGGYAPRRRYGGAGAVHRQPMRTRVVGRGPVQRPRRPGVVRVVTPVRIPPRGGQPGRTVRVVSDVKVPRGAVPAGRPVSLRAAARPRTR